jgi:two-component system, sensor histidine kinase and response regulator
MNTVTKILVIEDEPQIRSNLAEILTLHQFDTATAADGSQGVEMAQNHIPDVILCDVTMPKLDGFGVLEQLRQIDQTAHIPFIFLTSHDDRPSTRKGMELGADDYLTKPCTAQELLGAIQTQLEKRAIAVKETQAKLSQLRRTICHALPHEIYTPLNGIIGFSELLVQEHFSLPEEEELEIAQSIRESATRLHHLSQNFLIYSELELIASNPEKVQALQNAQESSYIRKVVSEVAYQQADSALRLADLKLELDNVPVLISELKLKKIAEELINNAFKFSQPRSPVHVLGRRDGDRYWLRVIDQGRGMTREQIESIGGLMQFERKQYEQQGIGLGLSIAKRMVELHQGQLTIESIPGEVTRINVWLPVRSEA